MGERLGVDRGVQIDAHVPEHHSLDAGELGECLLEHRAPGFEPFQFAQHLEQPPVGLLAALADRLQQLLKRRVGVEHERLGWQHGRHPPLHIPAGHPHQVRPVVDPQPVGVQLVHQVARLAGVEPLGHHRLVADRQADEHVEVLGALAARGGRQKPAVGGRAEANLGERLMSLGRRAGVAERLVGDQQVPAYCLQVGRVAVERAVAAWGRLPVRSDTGRRGGRGRPGPSAGRARSNLVGAPLRSRVDGRVADPSRARVSRQP
ncbi:MAG: hypothetical protein WAL38_15925 [Solirubrobacteraceae bacterium]